MEFFSNIGLGLETALSLHNLLYCLYNRESPFHFINNETLFVEWRQRYC